MPRFDPRAYQIASLSILLAYGVLQLRFDTTLLNVAILLGTSLATQWACSRLWHLLFFDPKSALISGLSLCLLLRTRSPLLLVVAAVVTIASKFVIRWRGKHIFNPTNGGIVLMMLAFEGVWVSPGQWGNVAFFGFLIACLGGLVVNRAARSDVTYAFAFFYAALLFYRSLYIGEPMTIPLHRLQSGALLLFTFFMISDPKTTPSSRAGRILFAALVAFGAYYVQFKLFRTNGLLWSLAAFSMVVPLIDWLLPGELYVWRRPVIAHPLREDGRPAAPAPWPGLPVRVAQWPRGPVAKRSPWIPGVRHGAAVPYSRLTQPLGYSDTIFWRNQ